MRIPRLDVALQVRVCRRLAADLRAEAALGHGPIRLRDRGNGQDQLWISRADAALNMDEQGDRWEAELKTGIPNAIDRSRIGEPVVIHITSCEPTGPVEPGSDWNNLALRMLVESRGGIPEKCDFCERPFTEERYPTPEEGRAWACIECVNTWEKLEQRQREP